MKRDLKIVFMGTPEFAVPSLDILIKNNYNIAAVVTTPDKPAGRGLKIQQSEIKKYASEKNIKILQPEKLNDIGFISQLKSLNANLQIIVAFRMLPEVIWKMPEYGTFNLHASLLPQYRGAAPINWAIINGEKNTGITTFFLDNKTDTGNIIMTQEIEINENETAGELHDKLMYEGAGLVLETVKAIEINDYTLINQSELINNNKLLQKAPKIFKDACKINWNQSADEIFNFIRGLSPYPTAWTEFISPDKEKYLIKIIKAEKEKTVHSFNTGSLITDNKNHLKITVQDGLISLKTIQQASKKPMNIEEFLRGFKLNDKWTL